MNLHYDSYHGLVCVCDARREQALISSFRLSQLRPHYLELLFRIVGTTDYSSHEHRQENITQCLQWIDKEEGSESDADKEIVRKIWSEFPDLFAPPSET